MPHHATHPRSGDKALLIGALLLALVARAAAAGVDAETALRTASRGYAQQVRAAEQAAG